MATIIVKRPSLYQLVTTDYKIFIDGQQAGIIANGEIKEFNTTNGQHKISIKGGRLSSPDITIETSENKITTLKASIFKPRKWIWRILPGITPTIIFLYYLLKMVFHIKFEYMLFLIVPSILFSIYSITLGRKKYFILEEM